MTQPKITVTKFGNHTVLALSESITYQNSPELETHFQEIIEGNQSNIILESKGVSFWDSMALELLLRMQNSIKERGYTLKIVGLNEVCRDILISTRLINQFHVYKDMQEAIRETL